MKSITARFNYLGVITITFLGLFFNTFPQISNANSSPFTIGSVSVVSNSASDCPPGATCQTISVSCPNIQNAENASVAIYEPTTAVRGVLVTSVGLEGHGWAYTQGQPLNSELRADGFKIVSINWEKGWTYSASGEDAGSGHLACRPAAAIKWAYDTKYVPLGLSPDKVGKCGFCAVGHSGASTQITYALNFYGLDSILNAVIPYGGPSHGQLANGCTTTSTGAYGKSAKSLIDSSFGYPFPSTSGPCYRGDASFTSRWNQESVESGGNDYYHPNTRIHIINGSLDTTMVPKGNAYFAKLQSSGSPYLNNQIVSGLGHDLIKYPSGESAVHAAVLADTGVATGQSNPGPTPSGGDTSSDSSGLGDVSSPATAQNANSQSNKTNKDISALPIASSVSDVPSATLGALLNPTQIPKVVSGPWGWLIVVVGIELIGATVFCGWLLYDRYLKQKPLFQKILKR